MADHIVWDWNGTLFNDAHIAHEAAVEVFRMHGLPAVTFEQYRAAFARPISTFTKSYLVCNMTLPPSPASITISMRLTADASADAALPLMPPRHSPAGTQPAEANRCCRCGVIPS